MIALLAAAEVPLIDLDGTVFVQVAIFLVMMAVLYQLLFRPYLELRTARASATTGARQQAEEMEERADAILADYEQRLTEARRRGAEERLRLRTEGVAHEQKTLASARAAAQEEITEARARAQKAEQKARTALLAQAPSVAKQLADLLLGKGKA